VFQENSESYNVLLIAVLLIQLKTVALIKIIITAVSILILGVLFIRTLFWTAITKSKKKQFLVNPAEGSESQLVMSPSR